MRLFNETQRFDQWWIRLLMISLLGVLLFCLYSWFMAETAVDKVSPADTLLQTIVIGSIIPVLIFLYMIKLRTSIDEIGIHYQFLPINLSRKTIRWAELEKCYLRTYNAIKEYGGWGYRTTFGNKGRALNIKGNKGIQLELKTGEKLLIGTQKEEDARQVIQRYFKKGDE